MDALKRMEHDDLARIRERDATTRRSSQAETSIAELEWKISSLMISAGIVLAPIVFVIVVIALIWIFVI
jgi:hypothetical protein